MLQRIRDKSSGWLAGVILGLVILTMAFFGIDSYFTPKVETFAAKIEGPAKFLGFGAQSIEISQQEFRNRLERVRALQRNQMGEAFDPLAFESLDNKRALLDQMVDEALARLAAERDGVAVSSGALQKAILEVDAFKIDGKFNPDQYRMTLQTQGYTPAGFEALIREELQRDAIATELAASALAGEDELAAYVRLSQQTRDLTWVELPTPSLPDAAPEEPTLREWHASNASRYQVPETVAIEYVEIDASTLELSTSVDDATLRDRYEQQRTRFVTDPQYLASHLLVAVPADADAAAESAARERAAALAAQAREPGADFAALVREHSDDLGSKEEGGDLGAIEKGLFEADFEAAVFALEAGGISDPVRTAEGWHVIQLRELVPGSERPFEEVREELAQEFLETERERAFSDLSGRLIDRVYREPSALAEAAAELGLTLQRTPAFAQGGGEGVAALEAVRRAAFSEAQKIEGQASDAIEIGPNHIVVLRVSEHTPATTRPYEEVQAQVLADFNAERLAELAKAQAEALLERAHAGEALQVLADEVGRGLQSQAGVGRFAREFPGTLVQEAFRLGRPEGDTVPVGMAQLGGDRYALVSVTAVKDGDVSAMEQTVRDMMRQQLAQMRGVVERMAYLQALRQQYQVTVAEDRL
ncbi:MAG TPA: SurA N-terminal domain-containing protein [Arenimonas sp.]|nr:SurA N-terminal domain-containing protein [Arenimonas sp.]